MIRLTKKQILGLHSQLIKVYGFSKKISKTVSLHGLRNDNKIIPGGDQTNGKRRKKDFNAMLHDSKDMPKFQIITDEASIKKYGGNRMYFAPPIDYDVVMKKVPCGKVITAGIFVSIAAWASYQRRGDETPYWRTLKANGELNEKYPGGVSAQKEKLESEGHTVIRRGRKNIRYFVKDYENSLFELE